MNDGRCAWCGTDPLYQAYHDDEWGVPEADPRALWEKLVLDGFQDGLAWITILRKRPRFREVFAGFEPAAVAAFDEADVERLMADAGIIRNRAKILAAADYLAVAPRVVEVVRDLDLGEIDARIRATDAGDLDALAERWGLGASAGRAAAALAARADA